jgi:hypothetical protein
MFILLRQSCTSARAEDEREKRSITRQTGHQSLCTYTHKPSRAHKRAYVYAFIRMYKDTCYPLLALISSRAQFTDIVIDAHTHTHTHKYIYIYIFIYLYIYRQRDKEDTQREQTGHAENETQKEEEGEEHERRAEGTRSINSPACTTHSPCHVPG